MIKCLFIMFLQGNDKQKNESLKRERERVKKKYEKKFVAICCLNWCKFKF